MLNKRWGFVVPLVMITSISCAMTITDDSRSDVTENLNVSSTQFDLSGVIIQYDQEKSLIFINDKQYIIDGMGTLTPADLQKGQLINFNLEQSSTDEIGHITKIWIETRAKQ